MKSPGSTDIPGSGNLSFIEELHARYLTDPDSVSAEWRSYFERVFHDNGSPAAGVAAPAARQDVRPVSELQLRVERLVAAYRDRGHLIARLDPLERPRPPRPELEPGFYGLTERDLDDEIAAHGVAGLPDPVSLRKLLEHLQRTYSGVIALQHAHIEDPRIRAWLEARMENPGKEMEPDREERLHILTRLTEAVTFEEFIQKKYVGAKRFSLEGAESLITSLDVAVNLASAHGMDEIVMGMAHRGRLNVLANLIGKRPREIFREFDDADPEQFSGSGDVKYHLGHSGDRVTTDGRTVHLSLCFNPSHLEFVNPVALGRLRAKQDMAGDTDRTRGMVILIHGDAAYPGQGVVQESLTLSELPGYCIGGTLHIIVNNQIGFTTAPGEGRSSLYASDVSRMLQVPIFHVNGDEPEAVVRVTRLALDFRREFRRDVVIDLYSYRRHGHNEGDEPAFTHPVMYAAIRNRPSVRERYLARLIERGEVTREEANKVAVTRRAMLEEELEAARSPDYALRVDSLGAAWTGFRGGPEPRGLAINTGVVRQRLVDLLGRLAQVPEGFQPHPKLGRWLEARREMAAGTRPIDWSAAEALALASLAVEGTRVRLSGQDTGRGTFSQRHAVFHDARNGEPYIALQNLAPRQAAVEVLNSPLSEVGAMGYEYGYSLDDPRSLVLWEAQFGDFCNVAQVIIDQFLVSAEEKWRRLSGLVLLLPHGFEGQGPEHSSARLERFLSLCAEDNMQVVNPTTPAQYFHVLRRQALRPWRKPLIVMTPKSLLRHPRVVATLDELAGGSFQAILPDAALAHGADGTRGGGGDISRVLLCSGKIYYDLLKAREERGVTMPILRLEQLYPLHVDELETALAVYPQGTPVVWIQEEPENMGAWSALRLWLDEGFVERHPLSVIARRASASPATGSARSHELEQRALMEKAFA